MDLRSGVVLGQRQQLILTHRMQQALRVLQAPQAELAQILTEALAANPFLEELPRDDLPAAPAVGPSAGPAARDGGESPQPEGDGEAGPGVPPAVAAARGAWEDRDRMGQIPDRRDRWREELLGQFRLEARRPTQIDAAEYMLGCLDDRGYLAVPVAEVATATGVPAGEVEQVRQALMRLDPPGLAARDPAECLRVQLEVRGEGGSLAARVAAEDLRLIAGRRFDELAARLGATREGVQAAVERLRRLWPHPACQLPGEGAPWVQPDLRIEAIDGEWHVFPVDGWLPRLRLVKPPRAWLRHSSQETQAFVTENLSHARWLLGSLRARRRTLVRLMRFILEEQQGFFQQGVEALQPLGYRRMAALMGLHESTIARAVRGKHVETPRGLFALRFFFGQGLTTREGTRRASAAVAHRIGELIRAEGAHAPLSDEEIAHRLHREGICIARRTVAKYRDRMGIPKASFRRPT
jgi:RNA polymerase sigma-54 factor